MPAEQSFLVPINLNQYEVRNPRVHNLAAAPSDPVAGQIYFDTNLGKLRYYDGAGWITPGEGGQGVQSIRGSRPIQIDDSDANNPIISILAATDAAAGSMSATDKAKLDAATSAAAVSTIVMRDGSGDFEANVITASMVTGLDAPSDPSDAVNKGYVDALVTGAVRYRGTADASEADPEDATGHSDFQTGDKYKVTVSGEAFGFHVNAGDFVIFNGVDWDKIDNTDPTVTGTPGRIEVTQIGDTEYQVDIDEDYDAGFDHSYTQLIGDGVETSFTINAATHGLGATVNLLVATYDASTGDRVYPNERVNASGNGTVTITFAEAPAENAYRVVILG